MTSLPRDPLTSTDRLLIDGTNLLHAMTRSGGPAPAAALIGRLRGAIPPNVGIEIVFDGAPDRGMRGERVAGGLIVRHAGRRSADEVLVALVEEVRATAGSAAAAGVLVVSDDHDLRAELRRRGARTAGSAWLLGRLERPRLASPSVGNRRPPASAAGGSVESADRPGWKPGRGATVKRGNPCRRRPSSGRMPP
ncbi:MAG: hypothetical protein WEG56_08005 [Chloroflexota bacterium]